VMLIVLLPAPTPTKVCVFPLPTRLTFLTMSLVAPSAPAVCIQTTAELVLVLVFVIVRSRDDVPLFEPSTLTKSAPLSTINALVLEPVIVTVLPAAGLIVIVLIALAPGTALIVIG